MVDIALDPDTNEIVLADNLDFNPDYFLNKKKIGWKPKPDTITNWDEIPEEDKKQIVLTFKEGHIRTYKKGEDKLAVWVRPHFVLPNKEKFNIIWATESAEHKKAKNCIYRLLKDINKPLFLLIDNKTKINFRNLELDYTTLEIESPVVDNWDKRRLDVKIQFKKQHEILGLGITFEIQFSKQTQEVLDQRSMNFAKFGLSCVWLYYDMFDKETFELNTNIVECGTFLSNKTKLLQKHKSDLDEAVHIQRLQFINYCEKLESLLDAAKSINNKTNLETKEIFQNINQRVDGKFEKQFTTLSNKFHNMVLKYDKTLDDSYEYHLQRLMKQMKQNWLEVLNVMQEKHLWDNCRSCLQNKNLMPNEKGKMSLVKYKNKQGEVGYFIGCTNWNHKQQPCRHKEWLTHRNLITLGLIEEEKKDGQEK